tara:strand:- start:564 stop:716 length:153 start_codon:yes stop_codon:yes gene_type:complete
MNLELDTLHLFKHMAKDLRHGINAAGLVEGILEADILSHIGGNLREGFRR